jgi:hypothetical protein
MDQGYGDGEVFAAVEDEISLIEEAATDEDGDVTLS